MINQLKGKKKAYEVTTHSQDMPLVTLVFFARNKLVWSKMFDENGGELSETNLNRPQQDLEGGEVGGADALSLVRKMFEDKFGPTSHEDRRRWRAQRVSSQSFSV